jgi:hypothetical protein
LITFFCEYCFRAKKKLAPKTKWRLSSSGLSSAIVTVSLYYAAIAAVMRTTVLMIRSGSHRATHRARVVLRASPEVTPTVQDPGLTAAKMDSYTVISKLASPPWGSALFTSFGGGLVRGRLAGVRSHVSRQTVGIKDTTK